MNLPVRITVMVFLSVASSAWSQTGPPAAAEAQPTVAEIAASFTNYQQITKNVVFVNPQLAALCRGISQQDLDAALARFGPHANAGILIFMNDPAARAFGTNASAYPVGAVVVKLKLVDDRLGEKGVLVRDEAVGVGGMVKRPPGYDPEHGDWEYFYFEDARKIESGHIASCVQCHQSAKDRDYVFGSWREQAD